MPQKTETVHILTVTYPGGTEHYVMDSLELANAQLFQYVVENDGVDTVDEVDADQKTDLIEAYFAATSGEESYTIVEEEILTEVEKVNDE